MSENPEPIEFEQLHQLAMMALGVIARMTMCEEYKLCEECHKHVMDFMSMISLMDTRDPTGDLINVGDALAVHKITESE